MKSLIKLSAKKIKGLIIISVLFVSANSFAYNWYGCGPAGVHANNIYVGYLCNSIICASDGIYVDDSTGGGWNFYTYGGLPVWDALKLDSANMLLTMGNGSYSDGIYKFDLTTHQFHVVEWLYIPTFIKFDYNNNYYYAGSRYNGMLYSTDGLTWNDVPYFQSKAAAAMDIYLDEFSSHIVVSQENNIFATFYSNDNGYSWNQSASNIPIHDLAFAPLSGGTRLYGVFTGVSNSSGLYSSNDFGATWSVESWTENMNAVGTDLNGNVFAGWHSSTTSDQGIALYDPQTSGFTFMNNGLPNKNINKIKAIPQINKNKIFCILYCCTDSGVYCSNDYLTGISDIKNPSAFTVSNYPNPFSENTTISYNLSEKNDVKLSVIDIAGREISSLVNQTQQAGEYKINFNAGNLKSGIYYYRLNIGNNTAVGKMVIL